ncbi:unnamed protein product [marine sediment metagenome]|uniref:Uncharacterized protein n=1 Tax=marine sediment metagenome TaxID=412755 RepID=X1K8B9_9ZZZZ
MKTIFTGLIFFSAITSLILVAIIYSVLLIRTNAILPKIVDVDTQDDQQQEKNSDTEATEDDIENFS